MQKDRAFNTESGNTIIIILVVLAVAAVGVLAFISSKNISSAGEDAMAEAAAEQATDSQDSVDANAQNTAGSETKGEIIKPGNPVVAKVGDEEVKRSDVLAFIQTLPQQTKQLPIGEIFPLALEQVVNARVIKQNTDNIDMGSDPLVKERVKAATDNIVRDVYMQRQVEKKVTQERLKAAYDEYVENFPDIDEVRARHILVEEEAKATEIIKKLQDGSDFATLAKENSKDATSQTGGDIGYFSRQDVVKPFADVAFALDVGAFTQEPVKTEFGYHVIQVEEKRKRPPVEFEKAKPFLQGQLNQTALSEIVEEWREKADVTRFDINGNPVN